MFMLLWGLESSHNTAPALKVNFLRHLMQEGLALELLQRNSETETRRMAACSSRIRPAVAFGWGQVMKHSLPPQSLGPKCSKLTSWTGTSRHFLTGLSGSPGAPAGITLSNIMCTLDANENVEQTPNRPEATSRVGVGRPSTFLRLQLQLVSALCNGLQHVRSCFQVATGDAENLLTADLATDWDVCCV